MAAIEKEDDGGGRKPVPDPTQLTTQALIREISSLRELLESKIEGHQGVVEARLHGMDKAIELLQTVTDRQPAQVADKIGALRTLHEEKFSSIQTQFTERDVRNEQTARDSKVAVDAALQAAKEAVGEQNKSSALAIAKSEAATSKQIDGLDGKIADTKERLTRIEGQAQGVSGSWGVLIGAIGIAGIIGSGVGFLLSRNGAPPPPPAPNTVYIPATPGTLLPSAPGVAPAPR